MNASRNFIIVGQVCLALLSAAARQELPEAVSSHERAAPLLEKRVVRLHTKGQAALAYQIALDIIHADDFLQALQGAYAAMLPDGESPEFTVQQTSPGQYAYKNRDGENTTITEVHRAYSPEQVELYFFSEGNRFFGAFEALTAITVKPRTSGEVDWQVQVYAYPRNPVSRLVARTGVVNRFFRSKTHEITTLAVQIGVFMTNQQECTPQVARHAP